MENNGYNGVKTRFLRKKERQIHTLETEMPLVFEPTKRKDVKFLKEFLEANSDSLMKDVGTYGALLFRGFDIQSEKEFENAILSIKGLNGISEAFMAESGRERVGDLKYVLHTNTIYKTGGTLYLGGFHSENYYIPDVPGFISFFCLQPSRLGGETGLINMEKVYEQLNAELKEKLEHSPCFVEKWLVSDVAKKYKISVNAVEKICRQFDLPIVGKGEDKLILMFKPSVFLHPVTQNKALQINFFSLPALDIALRKCFLSSYSGREWFWHRFVWKLPVPLFKSIEKAFVFSAALLHSPKAFLSTRAAKKKTEQAFKKLDEKFTKVNSRFSEEEINHLAPLMQNYYCSILWKKGDILLVDNRKVAHAGMPGAGSRVVRALISNPLKMKYSYEQPGCFACTDSESESIGHYMKKGKLK